MAESALRIAGTKKSRSQIKIIAGFLIGSLIMAAGYTIFGAILFASVTAALASTPGLLMEGLLNSIIAIIILKFIPNLTFGRH